MAALFMDGFDTYDTVPSNSEDAELTGLFFPIHPLADDDGPSFRGIVIRPMRFREEDANQSELDNFTQSVQIRRFKHIRDEGESIAKP